MATQVTPATWTQKILFTGSEAAIAAATKVETGLYFATDTNKIYKGGASNTLVDYSQAARVVTAVPASPAKSALYIVKDGSGNFVKAVATDASANTFEISWAKVTTISSSSDDTVVPTAKAVYDYVDSIVGGDSVVTAVAGATGTGNSGKLHITYGDGSTATSTGDITVPGVALKPSYESSTRTITIPYTENGSDPAGSVVINLGKDMVVTAGKYNAATEEIWLWILDHDPDTAPADIKIPVGALVDEIKGGTTNTAVTTYTASTNTLTADVRVSGKNGNAIQVLTSESTAGDNGLYVDLSSYALATDVENNATDIGTLDSNLSGLESALTTWTVLAEPTP